MLSAILLVSAGSAPAAALSGAARAADAGTAQAPLAAETFVTVDRRQGDLQADRRTEYRAPASTVDAAAWTVAQNGEGYLTAGFWDQATSTSVRVQLWAGAGKEVELGHTYTGLPLWYNRGAGAGANCEQATITVWELEAVLETNAVTKLAMDATCPNEAASYTVRINSSHPYAWLSATMPAVPAMYPGETTDRTWTLTAHGTMPVAISELGLTSGGPPVTLDAETCSGVTLDPGETCTAAVHIAPIGPGLQSGSIRVVTDLERATWYGHLSIPVMDPWAVAPSSLPLGSAPATTTSGPGAITVAFAGPGTGTVQGVTLGGITPSAFSIDADGCTGVPIAGGETCTIDVTATPPGVAEASATLSVNLGPNQGAKVVALSVTGTNPVSITPSVVIDTIRPGQTADAVVTLTSEAAIAQPITSVVLANGRTDLFSVIGNGCTEGIPAVGSCSITVRYAPPAIPSPWDGNTQSVDVVVEGPGFVGHRASQITGSNALPALGATWTARASLGGRWNLGGALARAVDGGTTTLVQVSSSGYAGSKPVKNTGPYMPVYLNRSTNGGASWSSSTRVNPGNKHGFWPVTAASGRKVAVAWVSAAKVFNLGATAPRVLWVRVSTNSGSGSWGSAQRITSTSGRVDHPSIAISGSTVVVGYTNAATGDVKVATSKDRGRTWKTVKVGTTSVKGFGGRTGLVNVAVSGKTIAVAWIASLHGSTKVRISTNTGTSFGTATSLPGAQDMAGLAIAGSRIGVAWLDGNLNVRIRTSGTWGPKRVVPTGWGLDENGSPSTYQLYGPAIALFGTAGIAAAASGEYTFCGGCDPGNGSDLVWSESSTNGAMWTSPDRIALASDTSRYNDMPSIVWTSATERYVLVNRFGTALQTTLFRGATAGMAPALAGGSADSGATVVEAATGQPGPEPAGLTGPWGPGPASDR